MSSGRFDELIELLTRVRRLLLLPDNDFAWSSWEDADAATREIDSLIGSLSAGQLPPRLDLSVLFAPTGPIQEVGLSSGWGDEFLTIAEQFDRALEKAYRFAAAPRD
jgi:hypothetical protein